jgi:intracellular septation protein
MTDPQPTPQDAGPPKEAEIDPQQLWKLLVELGPLLLFFFVNSRAGIFWGTGTLVVATAVSIVVSRVMFGKLAIMPLVSAFFVIIFGGLTLWLADDLFIKLKPTIVNSMFGAVLLGGLALGKPLLPLVLDSVFRLTSEGWRKLTFRWAIFFFVLAALNEIVWRTQTTDFWVNFKVFAIMPLTLAFALAQTPLILRHEAKDEPA